jgi:hypothetical protein
MRMPILAVAGALALLTAIPLRAQPAEEEIRKTVQFALQCNATVGTIEHVVVTERAASADGATVIVRGTYRQSVPVVSAFAVRSPDAAGGVFEAVYPARSAKMTSLQFKISLRNGNVRSICLR